MRMEAGIVTYNPDIDLLEQNLLAICPQVPCVIVVDNASANLSAIKELVDSFEQSGTFPTCVIQLMEMDNNVGIATALNTACQIAMQHGAEWLITLDQDSIVPENMVEEYCAHADLTDAALLCPRIFDRNNGRLEQDDGNSFQSVSMCITSGTATNLTVWEKEGHFDDSLFMYYVDTDYCWRVLADGYRIYRVNGLILNHSVGTSEERRFLLKRVRTENYSPTARYYIARNGFYVCRKLHRGIGEPLHRNLFDFFKVLFYEENKGEKCRAIVRGAKDGFRRPLNA